MISMLSMMGITRLAESLFGAGGGAAGAIAASKVATPTVQRIGQASLLKNVFERGKQELRGHMHGMIRNALGVDLRSIKDYATTTKLTATLFVHSVSQVRAPFLETREFRVEQINEKDPIKSINKIHAGIISDLNVVNKNVTKVYDYTRKAFRAQDEELTKVKGEVERIKKIEVDLEQRLFKLNKRVQDMEGGGVGGRGMGGADEDETKQPDKNNPLWDTLKDLAEMGLTAGVSLYALRKLRRGLNRLKGRTPSGAIRSRPGRPPPMEVRPRPTAPVEKPQVRPWRRHAAPTPTAPATAPRRPGILGRGARLGLRVLGPLATGYEVYQQSQITAEERLKKLQEDEKNRGYGGYGSRIWNWMKRQQGVDPNTGLKPQDQLTADEAQRTEGQSDNFILKKSGISFEARQDIKLRALQTISHRARRIHLKADEIKFDAPRIVFTSNPQIEERDEGGSGVYKRKMQRSPLKMPLPSEGEYKNLNVRPTSPTQTPFGFGGGSAADGSLMSPEQQGDGRGFQTPDSGGSSGGGSRRRSGSGSSGGDTSTQEPPITPQTPFDLSKQDPVTGQRSTSSSDATGSPEEFGDGPVDKDNLKIPASIRHNNPGAQYPGSGPEGRDRGQRYEATGESVIGGGHKIQTFKSQVHGAASNFDLLHNNYATKGWTVGKVGQEWTGHHGFGVPGFDSNTVLTQEMLKDKKFAIAFMKAIAEREAGRKSPLTDKQWDHGYRMFESRSAKKYVEELRTNKEIKEQGEQPTRRVPTTTQGPDTSQRTMHIDEYSGKKPPSQPTEQTSSVVSPVTGKFGENESNVYGADRKGSRAHSGVDFRADNGTHAVAIMDGKVTYIGHNPGGYDHYAVIKHKDGTYGRYAYHGTSLLKVGQDVKQGQPVGVIDRRHLHFEIIPPTLNGKPNPVYQDFEKNGNASTQNQRGVIDPQQYFGGIKYGTIVTSGQSIGAQPQPQAATFGTQQQHDQTVTDLLNKVQPLQRDSAMPEPTDEEQPSGAYKSFPSLFGRDDIVKKQVPGEVIPTDEEQPAKDDIQKAIEGAPAVTKDNFDEVMRAYPSKPPPMTPLLKSDVSDLVSGMDMEPPMENRTSEDDEKIAQRKKSTPDALEEYFRSKGIEWKRPQERDLRAIQRAIEKIEPGSDEEWELRRLQALKDTSSAGSEWAGGRGGTTYEGTGTLPGPGDIEKIIKNRGFWEGKSSEDIQKSERYYDRENWMKREPYGQDGQLIGQSYRDFRKVPPTEKEREAWGSQIQIDKTPEDQRPSSERYSNPAAAYPSAYQKRFGMEGFGILGDGHVIGKFPGDVHGISSNMDLFSRSYVGLTIGAAQKKWSGRIRSSLPGYDNGTKITPAMANDPNFMIPFFRAMANAEAKRTRPITDDELQKAFGLYQVISKEPTAQIPDYPSDKDKEIIPSPVEQVEAQKQKVAEIEKEAEDEGQKKDIEAEEKTKRDAADNGTDKEDSSSDTEKAKSKGKSDLKVRDNPEAESKGANDNGYGSEHRDGGDSTGTTDNSEE